MEMKNVVGKRGSVANKFLGGVGSWLNWFEPRVKEFEVQGSSPDKEKKSNILTFGIKKKLSNF